MITREEHGELRAGRITGSIAQRIMDAVHRTTWNTIARDLRNPRPFYGVEDTPNMPEPLRWGQLREPQAAAHFWELHPEYDIHHVPFLHWHNPADRERHKWLGFSPDRMLTLPGHDSTWTSGLEIKCPWDNAIHTAVVKARTVPDWCIWQIYHGMWVTGLSRWWFVCFDPRPEAPEWRYFDCEVIAEEARMRKLTTTIDEFLESYSMGEEFKPRTLKAADFARLF